MLENVLALLEQRNLLNTYQKLELLLPHGQLKFEMHPKFTPQPFMAVRVMLSPLSSGFEDRHLGCLVGGELKSLNMTRGRIHKDS